MIVYLSFFFLSYQDAPSHTITRPKIIHIHISKNLLIIDVYFTLESGLLSMNTRKFFDQDGDGTLNDKEEKRLGDYLEREAIRFLKIRLNKRDIKFKIIDKRSYIKSRSTTSGLDMEADLRCVADISLNENTDNILEITDRYQNDTFVVKGILSTDNNITIKDIQNGYLLDQHKAVGIYLSAEIPSKVWIAVKK